MIQNRNKREVYYRILPVVSIICLVSALIVFLFAGLTYAGPLGILGFSGIAIYARSTVRFKGLSFTLWILASVTTCISYPGMFTHWGDFELKNLIVPLIQLIMFGMGTTLCINDFSRVFQMPRAFLVGILLQFMIMPLIGFLLAKTFGLTGMIAVGFILVGSCPGGVASNVITYLARGNVALSVTLTACSTLTSPLMTPLMMKLLANQYTHIDFLPMMLNILQMIILPVLAGLVINKLLYKYSVIRDRILPFFSMVCLCFIITIITALSRERLLTMGVVIFSAAVLHNTMGYLLGYWGARLLGLDEICRRTIAIEVGMQNGGMASGIAMSVLNSADAGLAPAIFGAWQNVSGSILASIWRRRPAQADVSTPNKSTSRSNIYYWKCDNPLPIEDKLLYNRKYEVADISPLVQEIGVDYFGDKNLSVVSANGEGNHYAYILKTNGSQYFFRADDGKTDDDYMEAEGAVMSLVRQHGVRVPQIFRCDVSLKKYPVRFQIMEKIEGKCLNEYDRLQTLNRRQIGVQLGEMLAKMHSIKLEGYGFINTHVLRSENRLIGLDISNKNYFYKRLDSHLKSLRDTNFLSLEQIKEIETLIEKHSYLLNIEKGSILHKDIAFWNMIGTQDEINALIDWDDVVIGDPADDVSVLRCFYDEDVLIPVCQGYEKITPMTDLFKAKTSLYLVRNMLWKAVIRMFMQYYENPKIFILNANGNNKSLKHLTAERLFLGIEELRKL